MTLPLTGAGPSGAGLPYLLNAPFTGDDQGYADGQVLDTVAEGVQDGQLTVVEKDGTLAIVSNKCAFTAQDTYVDGDLGFYSQAITRALGRALFATANVDSIAANKRTFALVWNPTADAVTASYEHIIYMRDGQFRASLPAPDLFPFVAATDYQLALVLGGYDVNGVPWRNGQTAASYLYGAAFYIKGGAFTTWTLFWRDYTQNTATLYAMFANNQNTGTIDAFRVPDYSYSAVLQPTCLSTFTAANGVSLDAITPEVGGAWTEQSGDYDIQTNKANCVSTIAEATVETGIADFVADCTATPAVDGQPGIMFRYSDATHKWLGRVDEPNQEIRLYEWNGGATERASSAFAVTAGTPYDIRVIADGQQVDVFVDGGSKISYASASVNETETKHGIRESLATTSTFDNFAVYSRTSSAYAALDKS